MYFSLWHWQQMVNGYSGFTPDDHEQLVEDARRISGCSRRSPRCARAA